MIKSFIINKYLSFEFLKVVLNMCFVFFCLGFILNLFEEINFFKDFDVGIEIPILLTALLIPALLYNMFPFLILLSGIWFFRKIKKNDEIIGMKISGISNFSVILVPSTLVVIIGIIFVTFVNPITSILVKNYENIKSKYETDQWEYLATVNVNGIWIKEKIDGNNYIIRSTNLDNDNLLNLTIYEFDNNSNFIRRIEAASANIKSKNWNIIDATITDRDGETILENINNYTYKSMYDIEKIKSLYSNLDTVSFWNLSKEIKLLQERGYSTSEMQAKFQRSLAFPLFLLSMVLLSGVFTLSQQFKDNNWTYVFVSIISSALIFYFNDFSAALGKTEKLPIELSVWMPIVIIFIFGTVGLIHANQK